MGWQRRSVVHRRVHQSQLTRWAGTVRSYGVPAGFSWRLFDRILSKAYVPPSQSATLRKQDTGSRDPGCKECSEPVLCMSPGPSTALPDHTEFLPEPPNLRLNCHCGGLEYIHSALTCILIIKMVKDDEPGPKKAGRGVLWNFLAASCSL